MLRFSTGKIDMVRHSDLTSYVIYYNPTCYSQDFRPVTLCFTENSRVSKHCVAQTSSLRHLRAQSHRGCYRVATCVAIVKSRFAVSYLNAFATATKSRMFTVPSPLISGSVSPKAFATATRSRIFTVPSPLTSVGLLISAALR